MENTQIRTNIENGRMKDDFSSELLNGKIQLASTRGYPSKPKHPQEDAIGSAVKSENCFLNIVADGLGGEKYGKEASQKIVSEILDWFENTSEAEINNTRKIERKLKNKIRKVNIKLFFKYNKKASTTFALSLTNKYKTIILNTGDSTVYAYDDKLKLLTYIKFFSMFRTYEQIRKSLFNNYVAYCIGSNLIFKIHKKTIDNKGQRLILSTDGVTDLISEERFKGYFINKTDASQIVHEALTTPDIIRKSEDNISAITVDLPNPVEKPKQYTLKHKN